MFSFFRTFFPRIAYTGVACVLLSTPSVFALDIKPGLWRMDLSFEQSILPIMPPQTHQECIIADKVSVEDFMIDAVDCTFDNIQDSAKSMSWDAVCKNDMGSVQGKWETRVIDENNGAGSSEFMLNFGGFQAPVKAAWKATYIGPCA